MNKKILFLLIILIIVSFGCTEVVTSQETTQFENVKLVVSNGDEILFSKNGDMRNGLNDFDAVDILLDGNLDYDEYDFGFFITSIVGVTPGPNQFWSLYIDGEKASQGILSYTISKDILIEFKLEELQTF